MAELAKGIRAYIIIGLLAGLAALAGIFTLPPLDRDESRFAQATAQMLESGDYVSINFLDEARNKKPVGIHWLQAVSVAAFSSAEAREIWAYRLPSMFGAILAALACFWAGQRLVGRKAAFAGAALFAVTVLLGIEGGIAKTDAMLVGCTTLAMAALAQLRAGKGKKTALLFWFAIGLGALIKGPVTPMVAGLAILVLVIWERKANWLKPLGFWPGPLLAIAMILPWLISIQIATDGGFLRQAIGDDLAPKLAGAAERHGGLFGYHLLLAPLLLFPATLTVIPGLACLTSALRGRSDEKTAGAARFLLAWAIPVWLVFELLPTKLPHYVLPAYPALALIAGWGLMQMNKVAAWQKWTSWALFAFAGLVFAILMPVLFVVYGNNASWDAVRLSLAGFEGGFELGLDPAIAAIVFLTAALFAILTGAALMAARGRSAVMVLCLAVAAGLGWQVMGRAAAAPNAYAVRLADQVRAARSYSQTIAGIAPEDIATASSYTEPSLVFSLGTDTMLGTAEEVLAFAESRSDPILIVLDLSRDADLRALWFGDTIAADSAWREYEFFERLHALGECHRGLASGTNYSRGDETTLVLMFTRCGTGAAREGMDQ
ncbi:ArnT family glycosyltransferase [Maricaulis salignorans]|uniref:4-amino-4-deoxy-L-arabinose transferase n=1 Tax=Maricaulis salignorans TaxID=144026 RepID=A0A1G9US35_9PROT|nr:glycosyltransferase family 39 protein [Maricaulis salignorans]SDM62673.1 4-amino-4-deoxy-L-arabinose transferase [Maricaulis salignorans]